MTYDELKTGQAQAAEIQEMESVLFHLNRTLENWEKDQKSRPSWHQAILRLGNFWSRKEGKEVQEARALLFMGRGCQATCDLQVTPELLQVLRYFYENQLQKKKLEFENLGRDVAL